MKLSERLFDAANVRWQQAAAQPFVAEMAAGTLSSDRFRFYMKQDYFYLQEYIEILNIIRSHAETDEVRGFIDVTIQVTKDELEHVHTPNMKEIGITPEEIANSGLSKAGRAYLDYLRKVSDAPAIYGMTALLQCCWLYAYIARGWLDKSAESIATSPYRSWFEAYTSPDYTGAKDAWIALVDRMSEGVSEDEITKLIEIFVTCAGHENCFWEAAYNCG